MNIIAVNTGEDRQTVAGFVAANGYTVPIGVLPREGSRRVRAGSSPSRWVCPGGLGIPLMLVIGPDGRIQYHQMGAPMVDYDLAEEVTWMVDSILGAE